MADVQQLDMSGFQAMLQQLSGFQQTLEREQAQAAEAQAEEAAEAQQARGTFGAVIEAATLVAMADGRFSQTEAQRLVQRVHQLAGGRFSEEEIHSMAQEAAGRIEVEGAGARTDAVAAALDDDELRRGALLVAGAVGWGDGGIGTKEGLALQALARGFGLSINELHQILGQAHK
jgi:tellurite resistance protein